jgi:hypothetical protein
MESVATIKRSIAHLPPTVEVISPPRVARNLQEPASWLRELSQIYRDARQGRLGSQAACRLAYIASVSAKLAKDLAELKQYAAIHEQLQRIETTPPIPVVAVPAEHEVSPQ